MLTILKLVLFGLFIYVMLIGFYRAFRLLNVKITGSRTFLQVIGYAMLLIVLNLLLFFAGIYLFLKLYMFLSMPD